MNPDSWRKGEDLGVFDLDGIYSWYSVFREVVDQIDDFK